MLKRVTADLVSTEVEFGIVKCLNWVLVDLFFRVNIRKDSIYLTQNYWVRCNEGCVGGGGMNMFVILILIDESIITKHPSASIHINRKYYYVRIVYKHWYKIIYTYISRNHHADVLEYVSTEKFCMTFSTRLLI